MNRLTIDNAMDGYTCIEDRSIRAMSVCSSASVAIQHQEKKIKLERVKKRLIQLSFHMMMNDIYSSSESVIIEDMRM